MRVAVAPFPACNRRLPASLGLIVLASRGHPVASLGLVLFLVVAGLGLVVVLGLGLLQLAGAPSYPWERGIGARRPSARQVHFRSLAPAISISSGSRSIQIFQPLHVHQFYQAGRLLGRGPPLAVQLQIFPCILAEQRGVSMVERQLHAPPCAIWVVERDLLGGS